MRPFHRQFAGRTSRCFRHLVCGSIILTAALAAPLSLLRGAEPEEEIRSAVEDWRSAFNSGDVERVCDLFAPDLVANYHGEPQRDYASLCEMLRTALREPDTKYRYSVKIDEVMVYGDTAVVRLVWTLEIDRAGTPPQSLEEPAVDIFHRQAGGSWKISRYLAYPASR